MRAAGVRQIGGPVELLRLPPPRAVRADEVLIDVQSHQDAILQRLTDGTMPCDGAWPPEHITLFQRWIASGSAP
jgi:hypothetical protein